VVVSLMEHPNVSVKEKYPLWKAQMWSVICNNLETVRKLVLISNRKSNMGFRLVSKSVTLNDLEWRNGRYFALFYRIR